VEADAEALWKFVKDGKVKVDWMRDGVGDEIEEEDSGEEESEDTEMKEEGPDDDDE